ncbi:MAG TPA: peptide-methionine (S)-S-oxide reductase MsrA [Chitinophagales bacterium]
MSTTEQTSITPNIDTITLAGGCFWCVEAVYLRMKGVVTSTSGYANGTVKNPTYKEVCTGETGHAEVVQLTYDKTQTSLEDILAVFFAVHDPTTLNRQGDDVGTQYRSGIYYHNDEQKKIANEVIEKLTKNVVLPDGSQVFQNSTIVTEVLPLKSFYKAEDYHQDYYANNPQNPYCQIVARSKVEKFEKLFKDKVK